MRQRNVALAVVCGVGVMLFLAMQLGSRDSGEYERYRIDRANANPLDPAVTAIDRDMPAASRDAARGAIAAEAGGFPEPATSLLVSDTEARLGDCEGELNNIWLAIDCTATLSSLFEGLETEGWSKDGSTPEFGVRAWVGSWHFHGNWQTDLLIFLSFFRSPLRTGGFYVEAGAQDGLSSSQTLFLHEELGWKGMMIEPTHGCFQKLQGNRPGGDTLIHGGLCETEQKKAIDFPGCNKDSNDELVQCRPLQAYFDEQGVTHVDLISLDVEGQEMQALRSIDFSKTTVDVLLVEWRPRDGTERSDYLAKFGYKSHRLMQLPFRKGYPGAADELFWKQRG